jgi:Lar family restriction alleviation protein
MMGTLYPCPFCGGNDLDVQTCTPDREGIPTNIVCADCGGRGPWEYEEEGSTTKAETAWNKRVNHVHV